MSGNCKLADYSRTRLDWARQAVVFTMCLPFTGFVLTRLIRRAVKGAVFLRVQVPPGELSVHPSSYRGGEKGNQLAEALGTWVRHGRIGKPTGRNVREAWASLESAVVRVDLLFSQGRPPAP